MAGRVQLAKMLNSFINSRVSVSRVCCKLFQEVLVVAHKTTAEILEFIPVIYCMVESMREYYIEEPLDVCDRIVLNHIIAITQFQKQKKRL